MSFWSGHLSQLQKPKEDGAQTSVGSSTDLSFLILHGVQTSSSHSFHHQLHLPSVTRWTDVNQRRASLSEGLQVCVTGTRRVSDELSSGFFLSLMVLGSACLQPHLKWAAATCLGLYSVNIQKQHNRSDPTRRSPVSPSFVPARVRYNIEVTCF